MMPPRVVRLLPILLLQSQVLQIPGHILLDHAQFGFERGNALLHGRHVYRRVGLESVITLGLSGFLLLHTLSVHDVLYHGA
jgi:hypothetical protein